MAKSPGAKFPSVLALLLSGALAAGLCAMAGAQPYPMRPIELVSPTSPGSGTDIYARALADIVQRVQDYKDFFAEVGAIQKPAQ